jgi:hypothetical protein
VAISKALLPSYRARIPLLYFTIFMILINSTSLGQMPHETFITFRMGSVTLTNLLKTISNPAQ